MVDMLAAPNTTEDFRFLIEPVRWDQHLHGLTNRLARRVPENSLGTRIPTFDYALEIFADDSRRPRIGQSTRDAV